MKFDKRMRTVPVTQLDSGGFKLTPTMEARWISDCMSCEVCVTKDTVSVYVPARSHSSLYTPAYSIKVDAGMAGFMVRILLTTLEAMEGTELEVQQEINELLMELCQDHRGMTPSNRKPQAVEMETSKRSGFILKSVSHDRDGLYKYIEYCARVSVNDIRRYRAAHEV